MEEYVLEILLNGYVCFHWKRHIPYTNKLNAQRTVGKNNIGAPKIRINFAIAIC